MRALPIDFSDDKNVQNNTVEYMFGQSILVAPVTEAMYVSKANGKTTENFSQPKTKKIYLPAGANWYDFWTGEKIDGGQEIQREAPIDLIPLYVKAGSILPFGPKVQYATEKNWDKLEIRIYRGANGEFCLYEDENDNYNYEKGIFSSITFNWNDKANALTIADRKGIFPGMLKTRTFNIVLVDATNGVGDKASTSFTKTIGYNGKSKTVKF